MRASAKGEKSPILEPRAIGYRMGLKIGDFFPKSVTCKNDPRKTGDTIVKSPQNNRIQEG